jgi:alkylation response protein AidB-like acyl-CoA dehydrogenase
VFAASLWSTLIELGWPDVMVSEKAGGGGSGLNELCVLAEAAGAAAAPVPLAAAAGAAWSRDQCDTTIALVLPGQAVLSGGTVSGIWPVLSYGAIASTLICLATDGVDSLLVAVDTSASGVSRENLTVLDRNPASRLVLESAPFQPLLSGRDAIRSP